MRVILLERGVLLRLCRNLIYTLPPYLTYDDDLARGRGRRHACEYTVATRVRRKTVEDGAAGVVWLATLPDDGPTGGFFRDGRPVAF